MSTQTPVDKTSPLWLAWVAYIATAEYANTLKWAKHEQHTEGSLWAAFSEGFARSSLPTDATPPCIACGTPMTTVYSCETPGCGAQGAFQESQGVSLGVRTEDTERMNWLENNTQPHRYGGLFIAVTGGLWEVGETISAGFNGFSQGEGKSLREAIDKARSLPEGSTGEAPMSSELEQLRGVVWALSDELARCELALANATREAPHDWPAGQAWDELVSTSHSIMRRRAWTSTGLDPLRVVSLLCDNGSAKDYDETACRPLPIPENER